MRPQVVAAQFVPVWVAHMLATTRAKELVMSDPIVPPPGEEPPEPPTPRQDHAVLAWLAVEADLPAAVQLHLLDALNAWSPLMGPHLFPTEPEAGADCDVRRLLEAMWWRRSEQAADAPWPDKVALNELCGRLGLAIAALSWPIPPLPRPRSAGA